MRHTGIWNVTACLVPSPWAPSSVPPGKCSRRAGRRSRWCELSWGSRLRPSGRNAPSPAEQRKPRQRGEKRRVGRCRSQFHLTHLFKFQFGQFVIILMIIERSFLRRSENGLGISRKADDLWCRRMSPPQKNDCFLQRELCLYSRC